LNLFNRHADKLYMCNIAQIVNVLHSLLLTEGAEGKTTVKTSTYHAFMLFKPHRAKTAVRVEKAGADPLDLSASASKSGSEVIVTLVNPRHGADLTVDCAFSGAAPKQATAQILHHPDLNAYNEFEGPNQIAPKSHRVSVENGRLKLDVPSMGIVTVTVQTA
jgi:alpha-N-arabinofuranosidase